VPAVLESDWVLPISDAGCFEIEVLPCFKMGLDGVVAAVCFGVIAGLPLGVEVAASVDRLVPGVIMDTLRDTVGVAMGLMFGVLVAFIVTLRSVTGDARVLALSFVTSVDEAGLISEYFFALPNLVSFANRDCVGAAVLAMS
jgi:hypothetical protein